MRKLFTIFFVVFFAVSIKAQKSSYTENFDTDGNWSSPGGNLGSYTAQTYTNNDVDPSGDSFSTNDGLRENQYTHSSGYAFRLDDADADGDDNYFMYECSETVTEFSVYAARWDNSPSPSVTVEYSEDSGANWTSLGTISGNDFSGDKTYKQFTYSSLNISPASGKTLQIRFRTTAGERMLYDDFSVTYGGTTPVELKSFTATVKGNKVELNWATATEVNNYGFQVERKKMQGESDWKEIGFVQGHGNSNSVKYYSYIDNPFEKGSYSYRLKQIDLDGAFKYSDIVSVDLGSITKFALKQNYPNPFNPTTEISFDVPKESNVKLSVYNALGQKVADLLNEKLSAGTHRVRFDGSNLTSGIYFYKMQSAGFTSIKKMILMK